MESSIVHFMYFLYCRSQDAIVIGTHMIHFISLESSDNKRHCTYLETYCVLLQTHLPFLSNQKKKPELPYKEINVTQIVCQSISETTQNIHQKNWIFSTPNSGFDSFHKLHPSHPSCRYDLQISKFNSLSHRWKDQ